MGGTIRDVEDLAPLLAYLVLYLAFLAILRIFIWPTLLAIKKRGLLARLLGILLIISLRVLVAVLAVVAMAWALAVLGLLEAVEEFIFSLPDLGLPALGIVIPGAVILLFLVAYFVIRPVFARIRR